jgi:hypothetical protein
VLTCLVVVDRLLDCAEIEQIVVAHGTSCDQIRAAIRLLSDEPPEQPKSRGRWWVRPSHYGTEYWTAFVNAADTTISQRTPVMSARCLMRSILASPSGNTALATRLGLKTAWFESGADN